MMLDRTQAEQFSLHNIIDIMSNSYTRVTLSKANPKKARRIFGNQQYTACTNGCCDGYTQANVVILDKKYASDFRRFCELNSRPAPLLEELQPGNPFTSVLAHNADIRCCLPKYRIHKKDGSFEEVYDINKYWSDDLVTFFLGCSFSFEKALQNNGIKMRHIELKRNVPMFDTNIATNNVNGFGKHLVVSMRPIKKTQIHCAYKITNQLLHVHGSPIHFGNPQLIGIKDINNTDYGDSVPIKEDELPVFWACGVTTQVAVQNALKLNIMEQVITHSPGHMFISDCKVDDDTGILRKINTRLSKL
eukprot:77913_1